MLIQKFNLKNDGMQVNSINFDENYSEVDADMWFLSPYKYARKFDYVLKCFSGHNSYFTQDGW